MEYHKTASRPLHHFVSRLRLRHFELLALLGQTPNIRRCSAHMNITQPAASKMLKEIEQTVGAELFIRNRRGLQPTATGLTMIHRSGQILEEIKAASDELRSARLGSTGRLRIGIYPVAVPDLLAILLEQLNARLPGVTLYIEEGLEDALLPSLAGGKLDVVIGRIVPERLTEDLFYDVLYRQPTAIIAGRDHPIATAKLQDLPKALVNAEWILPSIGGATYNIVASTLSLHGQGPPNVKVECASMFVTIQLVQQTAMVSVIPAKVAQACQRDFGMQIVPFDLSTLSYPVGIIWRREKRQAPLVTLLVEAAKASAL